MYNLLIVTKSGGKIEKAFTNYRDLLQYKIDISDNIEVSLETIVNHLPEGLTRDNAASRLTGYEGILQ